MYLGNNKEPNSLSSNLFKILPIHLREMIIELRSESEDIAKMIQLVESMRPVYKTNYTGKIARDKTGKPLNPVENVKNLEFITEHIESLYYNKTRNSDAGIEMSTVPLSKFAKFVNGLFGKELIKVPEDNKVTISANKVMTTLNNFYMTKTLGLAAIPGAAHLVGGTINTFANAGVYIDKASILRAELKMLGAFFNKDEKSKKEAALLARIHPFLADEVMRK